MICWLIEVLYNIIPVASWRGFLVSLHIGGCPRCAEDFSLDWDESSCIGVDAVEIERVVPELDLVQPVARGIALASRRRVGWGFGVWAALSGVAVGAAVLVLIVTGVTPWGIASLENGGLDQQAGDQIVINSIRVENKPARTIRFQPEDKDKLIVWVQKNDDQTMKTNTM